MLKAWTPRVAEHTFQNADDFGTDVWFASRIVELERVEGDGIGSVGGVEIDDLVDARFGDETEIIDRKVTVGVDDAIALIVKYVAESKKLEHAGFAGAGLTDNVNVARTVAAEHTELVVDTAEVGETEGGNLGVVLGVTSDEREFGGRFGGFRGGPDDVGGFDGSMREMVNGSELGNVEHETVIIELAHFVGVEIFELETATSKMEAVEVSRIELLKSSDERLHV